MITVEPNNQFRVEEKDKLHVQFFDKKRQITNEDLETIDVLDSENKPIYDLYVEIYNPNDPYSVVCKNVAKNLFSVTINGVRKKRSYDKHYLKAFEIYESRKNNLLVIANDKDLEIEKLKKQLKELKKETEKATKNKNLTKEPEINLE